MTMKTINDAINERLSRLRNLKEMESERRVESVYRRFPELRKIDRDLIDVRTSRMICSIENDSEPLPALNKREEDLRAQREQFLKDNNIPVNFSEPAPSCAKCGDTGFVKAKDGRNVVCTACMQGALDEVFTASGLKDYSTYTLKSFDLNYYDKGSSGNARRKAFMGIRNLMEGKDMKKLQLLTGPVQSGKTYLAVICCKYAIMQGLSSCYIKADKLGELGNSEIEEFKSYDIIFIDDYSAEVTKLYRTATALHNILEARLAAGRATVIISSSSIEILVADSDERVAGKLRLAGTL